MERKQKVDYSQFESTRVAAERLSKEMENTKFPLPTVSDPEKLKD